MEEQIRQGLPQQPWVQLHGQVLLGEAAFIRKIGDAMRKAISKKTSRPRWLRDAAQWKDVVSAVERVHAGRWETFCNRYGHRGRDLALWLARRATGLTLRELAAVSGVENAASISVAVKRYERKIDKNKVERACAQRAARLLNVAL